MQAYGSRVEGGPLLTDGNLALLTEDSGLAAICRLASRSRAAAHAMDIVSVSGLVVSHAGPGAAGPGRIVIPQVLSLESKVIYVVRSLREAVQEITGVAAEAQSLSGGDRLAGAMLVEADAQAFVIHVAAQLARSGATQAWSHVASGSGTARAAGHYVRGYRKGGERTGAHMAFASLSEDPSFVSMVAARDMGPGTGRGTLEGLATRISLASPSGEAYPERGFKHAVQAFSRAAAPYLDVSTRFDLAEDGTGTHMRPAA